MSAELRETKKIRQAVEKIATRLGKLDETLQQLDRTLKVFGIKIQEK